MKRDLSTAPTKVKSMVTTLFLLVGLILAACSSSTEPLYPAKTWHKIKSPEALGWSSAKLKLAREYSEEIGSEVVMIIVNGEILDEWGDTTRKLDIRSMMKPLMNALYGIAVDEGKVNIQRTLAELGVDDKLPPLTDGEKQARIVVRISATNAQLLQPLFPWVLPLPQPPRRGALVATVVQDMAVALCYCSRLPDQVTHAGVETAEPFRGQGYATAAVVGWADEVRRQGLIPLYGTTWENLASQRIAQKLAMVLYSEDWWIA